MDQDKQRSPGWFKARLGKITGSNIGTILGLNQHQTPNSLLKKLLKDAVAIKETGSPNSYQTKAMEFGNKNEKTAIKNLEIALGVQIEEIGFTIHPEIDWLGSSPDGIIRLDDGTVEPVEVKCPYSRGMFKLQEDICYWHQCQAHMHVVGAERCWFAVWVQAEEDIPFLDSPAPQFEFEPVERDRNWLSSVLPRLEEFKNMLQKALLLPESDDAIGITGVERSDDDWAFAVNNWRYAKLQVGAAEEVLRRAREALIKEARDRSTKGCGVNVIRRNERQTIDYKRACTEHKIDLGSYTKPAESKPVWTIKEV